MRQGLSCMDSFWKTGLRKIREHRFLFEELVKRDFKQKYKRTVLGMAWSILNPLLSLFVMRLVFTQFFGRSTPHYTIFIFCGNIVWSYFSEATRGGMKSLMDNASIFTKVNVPKYLFLLSKNIQSLISFLLTLVILFVFVAFDTLPFSWKYICLLYPIVCLVLFNIGVGMVLSALFIFFRDTQYLYSIFLMLLNYLSAIFYQVDRYPDRAQKAFFLNPVYCNIRYIRVAILEGRIPSPALHGLLLLYGAGALLAGGLIYVKYNQRFLYYV